MAYDEQTHHNSSNATVAGVVGVAIGAAVGSAATAILTDEKKRTKVVGALKGFRKKAMNAADSMRGRTMELQKKAESTAKRTAKTMSD
jgi:gas vesicle protein